MNTAPNPHWVVDNPLCWSRSYCLPLAVVTYSPTLTPIPYQFPNVMTVPIWEDDSQAQQVPVVAIVEESWSAPFRWHWQQDGGKFEPYNDLFNTVMERAYERYSRGCGEPFFTTEPLTRYLDDRPQRYHINFSTNKQTNAATNYVRNISRRIVPALYKRMWEWQDADGKWQPFESLVQATIESAWNGYTQTSGASSVTVQFPGRPERYDIDFIVGTQTNTKSGESRRIRRA